MRRGHVVYCLRSCYVRSQQSRRQFRHFSSPLSVAVVNVKVIAQDSACARVYGEGKYSRVVGFVTYVTDAAKNREMWTKNTAL